MSNQPQTLFYDGKYSSFIETLNKTADQTPSKRQNLAVSKYLFNGDNPLLEFDEIEKNIKGDAIFHDDWPLHPSWPMLQYHRALYFFNHGKYRECLKYLADIWKHSDYVSDFLMLFVSLLTQEFSIRHSDFFLADKAQNFLSKNFPTNQKAISFLTNKIPNENVVKNIVNKLEKNSVRLKIAREIYFNKTDSAYIKETLSKLDKNSDLKMKKNISINQVLGLESAALLHQDVPKMEALLSSAPDQQCCCILNNKGIVEFIQKQYSSALLLFSKALKCQTFNDFEHPYQKIIYNIGVSLLLKEKPKKAFRCLFSIIHLIPRCVYLWIRLAECCVLFFRQRVAKLRRRYQLTGVVARKLSTATKTYTILPTNDIKLFSRYKPEKQDEVETHLTLEFAEKCTQNATELCTDDQFSLKMNIALLNQYICLELGDWKKTVELGKSLINLNDANKQCKILSRIYSSQALYMLHEYNKSCSILSPILFESPLNRNNDLDNMLYHTAWRTYEENKDNKRSAANFKKKVDPKCREVVLTYVAEDIKEKKTQNALSHLEHFESK